MTRKTRSFRPSPALVISYMALFLALAGTAFAAGVVGKNSVRSPQIADGAVHSVDIHEGAVNTTKVAPGAIGSTQIANDAVGPGQIGENAVGSPEVAPDSLTANDLGANSVGQAEVQPGAIGASELALTTGTGVGVEVPPGEEAEAVTNCPPGTTLLSGGAQSTSPAITIYETAPHGNGWIVKAHNNSNTKKTLAAIANCLSNISH